MLAYRTTWMVKPQRMEEALELLKAEVERSKDRTDQPGVGTARIYTPQISPNVLVFETTFESPSANEAFWAEYYQDSEGAEAFWEQWYEVVERQLGTEIWHLTEWE